MSSIETYESLVTSGEQTFASPEVAGWTVERLHSMAEGLAEAGFQPKVTKGKEVFNPLIPLVAALDLDKTSLAAQRMRREQQNGGGITELEIRRDPETGLITFAQAMGDFPVSIAWKDAKGDHRQDQWFARFQILPVKEGGQTPVTILDSWTLPLTSLTRLLLDGVSRDSERYSSLNHDLFVNKNVAGIPIAAEDVSHSVYGREGEIIEAWEFDGLADLLDIMFDGSQEAIAERQYQIGEL